MRLHSKYCTFIQHFCLGFNLPVGLSTAVDAQLMSSSSSAQPLRRPFRIRYRLSTVFSTGTVEDFDGSRGPPSTRPRVGVGVEGRCHKHNSAVRQTGLNTPRDLQETTPAQLWNLGGSGRCEAKPSVGLVNAPYYVQHRSQDHRLFTMEER